MPGTYAVFASSIQFFWENLFKMNKEAIIKKLGYTSGYLIDRSVEDYSLIHNNGWAFKMVIKTTVWYN